MVLPRVFFTSPIFGVPPVGGPELRIFNTLKVLASVAAVSVQIRQPVTEAQKEAIETAVLSWGCTEVQFLSVLRTREQRIRGISHFISVLQSIALRRNRGLALRGMLRQLSSDQGTIFWFGFGNISFPLIQKFRRKNAHVKIVCDTDSVWSRFLLRGVPHTRSPLVKLWLLVQGISKSYEERKLVKLATITTAVSPVDAVYYRSLSTENNVIKIVSNAIDEQDYRSTKSPSFQLPPHSVCLIGSFGFTASPMDAAAKWTIEKVWPLVQAKVPESHLFLVGNKSDVMWNRFSSDSIHVTGRVPSTEPYIQTCEAVIVPLFFESGTRFKILEAGVQSRPVVSTSLGAEGLPVTHAHDILIADDPRGFAEAIIDVLNGNLKIDIGKNLNNLVLRTATLASTRVEIENVLLSLGPSNSSAIHAT